MDGTFINHPLILYAQAAKLKDSQDLFAPSVVKKASMSYIVPIAENHPVLKRIVYTNMTSRNK